MTTSKFTALILSFLVLAGCASTEKKFKRGVEAEERGDYYEASNYFITVLERAPDYQPAFEHLLSAGTLAVDEGVASARKLERRGEYAASADELDRVESLVIRAERVGVILAVPDDFAALKNSIEEQAFNQLVSLAERAVSDGRWADALNEYNRAAARAPEARLGDIEEARAGVHLRWAEAHLNLLRFREAFSRAQYTIDALGPAHPLSQQAIALQEQALIDGTRIVAYLPLRQTEFMRRNAPGSFLEDLNDVLLYDAWSVPPPFLASVDNIEVRREVRRIAGRGSAVISRGDALEVGRVLGSDMIFSGELVDFSRDERRLREKTRKVKTLGRNPIDTTFTLKNYTQYFDAAVEYRIYNAHDRNVLYEGRAEASVSMKVERGEYAGDYRDLDLSSKQRDYFDRDEHERQDQELEERLADELAQKIAERVFEQALRQVD